MEGNDRQMATARGEVMNGNGNGDDFIRVARVALVAAMLLFVVWAVSGIIQAQAKAWERRPFDSRLIPANAPSDLVPPVNSGGCLVSVGGTSIVTRVQ